MDLFKGDIILVLALAFCMLHALLQIILNKPFLARAERYTQESLDKYSHKHGILQLIAVLCMIAFLFAFSTALKGGLSWIIVLVLLVITIAALISIYVFSKHTLVEK